MATLHNETKDISTGKNVIKVNGIGKEFNGVWVLKNIDFKLKEGEIHSLVGENGAGKSTFIKIISGIHQPSSGNIQFEGKPITFENVKASEKAGIRTVHQEINLVPYFSIYNNIFIGDEERKKFAGINILNDKKMKERAKKVINELGIDYDVNATAQSLNASMKRIVEISKVLVHNPKVVVFDEPTTSLGEEERKNLLQIIKGLKKRGLSIIYISHNLEEVMEISDRITVFRDGNKIDTITPEETTTENIVSMMIGHKTYNSYIRKSSYSTNETVLEAKNLYTDKLKDINFQAKKGEILGIAGVVGAGKTEIAKAIFGLDKITKGSIRVGGKEYNPTPQNAIANGISLVPEERSDEGLIHDYCVRKNITLTYLKKWTRWGITDTKEEVKVANSYIDKLNIKTTGHSQPIKFLSGGNQQKAILARWLEGNCDIGIFDEPTKGIDVKAKEDIYVLLEDLAKEGKSIIVLSSYLPELISTCDRILVIHEGELIGEYNPKESNAEETIMAVMLGGEA